MSKLGIILTYLSALVACVLIVVSLMCATAGSSDLAGYLAGLACFCLLLSIWANVCS